MAVAHEVSGPAARVGGVVEDPDAHAQPLRFVEDGIEALPPAGAEPVRVRP